MDLFFPNAKKSRGSWSLLSIFLNLGTPQLPPSGDKPMGPGYLSPPLCSFTRGFLHWSHPAYRSQTRAPRGAAPAPWQLAPERRIGSGGREVATFVGLCMEHIGCWKCEANE